MDDMDFIKSCVEETYHFGGSPRMMIDGAVADGRLNCIQVRELEAFVRTLPPRDIEAGRAIRRARKELVSA
jgi:hypothetical protein